MMTVEAKDVHAITLDARGDKTGLILTLVLVYILGSHLRLSLYSGDSILVPMYLMLLSSWALVLWFAPALWARAGIVFAVLAAFLVFQPIIGGGDNGLFGTIRNVMQLIASIGGALGILYALAQVDSARLRRLLIVLWVVLVVLAFVERFFLKAVFDDIRLLIYSGSGRFVYFAEDRDLQIYGQIRTTAFASEPSFFSDTLSAITVMVFMLGQNLGKGRCWTTLGAMVLISFSVAPSFKVVFYLVALLFWQFWPQSLAEALRLILVLLIASIVIFLTIDVVLSFVNLFSGGHMTTGSFFGRIGSAHLVGLNALWQFPIIGFGIGNREDVYRIIVEVWHQTGAFGRFPWYGGLSPEHLLSNGFWWMWIYLGVGGGVVFLALVAAALRRIGVVTPWRSLVCASIVWYAGSAFIDPQSWYTVVVFSLGALGSTGMPNRCDTNSESRSSVPL